VCGRRQQKALWNLMDHSRSQFGRQHFGDRRRRFGSRRGRRHFIAAMLRVMRPGQNSDGVRADRQRAVENSVEGEDAAAEQEDGEHEK
jgi:hypothetical protein